MIEELDESPLGPFVILGVAGAYFTIPVKAETEFVELLAVAGNVLVGGDGGMLAGLDGVLLGGKAVGVVAHGMEHVEATKPLVAGKDVAGDIAEGMTHMQPCSRGIGEHVQNIIMGLVGHDGATVSVMFAPKILPLGLDFVKVVIHSLYNTSGNDRL